MFYKTSNVIQDIFETIKFEQEIWPSQISFHFTSETILFLNILLGRKI